MKSQSRDLLLLLKAASFSSEQFEKEMECLNKILMQVECTDAFCTAHQLVNRFSITEKRRALQQVVAAEQLKPFQFLINKN